MKEMRKKIDEIKNITAHMPKTIMEAVEFTDKNLSDKDFGFDEVDEEMPVEEPMMDEPIDEPIGEEMPMNTPTPVKGSTDGMNVVDTIRKMALKTMADLADNPDDPAYVILKKVWQMCDKKPEDQNKSSME